MLIFQINQNDPRNVRLLDHEIPNYLTEVISEYLKIKKEYPTGIVSYEFIAQELIIMYIRRAIKQGHINHKEVIIIGKTSSDKHFQCSFDLNAKIVGNIPKELQNWSTIAMELM